MSRYVCVHGHFYQPPRENPWLEAIERQDSAAPYHDWNERVAAEAYAPNAAARILDERDRIVGLVNNYERISFNVGPTLMPWLEAEAPEVYRAILEADARSLERNGGHGSAIAQAYGHSILPLDDERDRRTQVAWGIRDFEARFRRRPEGMWLPETAVDVPTLEALAAEGIRFTILAPHQAARWRPLGGAEDAWRPGGEGELDPRRPYLQRLPSGREITLFFYDGALARGVAFEGLLKDGARFADRILEGFDPARDEPQLVHLATDGETFGHHHRHGEMALAFALERLRETGAAEIVNYGRYLDLHPPRHEVQIAERTSWSCAHGVERWRTDCGCHAGGRPGWDQRWRLPLRESLDALRARVDPLWETAAGELFRDPWAARDGYVDVLLDRSPTAVDRFLTEHAVAAPAGADRVRALELLELQRHALLVYTSCAWFFNDLAGIETVQILRYAVRVVELGEKLFGEPLEADLVERLAAARSNRPERGDGRRIWEREAKPTAIGFARICVTHAVRSLVEEVDEADPGATRLYAFRLDEEARWRETAGRASLGAGAVRVASTITEETERFLYAALHLGEHQVVAGVRSWSSGEGSDGGPAGPSAAGSGAGPDGRTAAAAEALREVAGPVRDPFVRGDVAEAIRRQADRLGPETFSLRDLLLDVRARVLDRILRDTLAEAEAVYEEVFDRYAPLMRFVADLGTPQPAALEMAGEFVLEGRLRRRLDEEVPDLDRVASLLEEARGRGVELDPAGSGAAFRSACLRLARRVAEAPEEVERLEALRRCVELARAARPPVELWDVQNAYWGLLASPWPERRERAEAGDPAAAEWAGAFRSLGRLLGFAPERVSPPREAPVPAATRPRGSWR